MDIPYIRGDVADTIKLFIDPIEIVQKLISVNEIDENEETYSKQVNDMCNIFTAAIGFSLSHIAEPGTIIVKEGIFGMIGSHTWIEIEDVIVDCTLAQFIPEAEQLCIIDKNWDQYKAVRTYEFNDWLVNSQNVA